MLQRRLDPAHDPRVVCSTRVTQSGIRLMHTDDIGEVVGLQTRFLEGSLVTDLGPRFLASFHRAALQQAATCAFVAVENDAIAGLAVGSVDVAKFNAHVKPRILGPLAASLLPPRRWTLALALLRTIVEPGPSPVIPAELLLLVVDGRCRHRGIGRRLLAALEHAFADAGVSLYRVAVRSHLDAARSFYAALDFTFEQELPVLGRPMTYLTKRLR
jgi:ribosomal protein S18 acetylase RimI-like enzyme